MVKVYIDGQEGTTGLKILERFKNRSDIELLRIDEDNRKPDCARFGKGFRQRKARSSDRAFRKKQDDMPALSVMSSAVSAFALDSA